MIDKKKARASGSEESPAKKSKTGPNHLALSKSFTSALCTSFMCSESDAENIFQQTWNESHGETENNNDKDDSSKL